MSGQGKVVCVTGASGYVASWLIKLLLEWGYTVKATVRDTDDPKKTQHLLALDGAKERLHLIKADLLDPAVKGTLDVLKSCAKVPSIKRVIVTSSMYAVWFTGKPLTADTLVDETWFSDPVFCEKIKNWYALSKTLAEKAAWNFAKENGINLVTITPGLVLGTLLQPTLNLSAGIILNLINGNQSFPGPYGVVDVKDVATAHIQAFELPSASGRYNLVASVISLSEIHETLQKIFPTLNLAKLEIQNPENPKFQVSRLRAESLAIKFTSWEESLKDTIESFKEKGFLSF